MGNVFRLYLAVILIVMSVGCGGNRAGDLSQTPTPGQGTDGPILTDPSLDLQNRREMLPGLGNEMVPQEGPVQQNMPGGNLPAFPGSGSETFSPVHKVSEAGFQTDGDGFVDSFGVNNRDGENAGEYVLIPEKGDIAWAMYSIPDLTGDRPVRIDISASPTAMIPGGNEDLPLSYWIGVSDYTKFHWDWYGPYTSEQAVEINSEELRDRYVDKDGTLHWVAVLYGDEEGGPPGLTLQSGTVVTDSEYMANKPHYTPIDTIEIGSGGSGGGKSASGLDPSQYITIDWSHIEAFNIDDEKNEAFQYRVYRRGPVDESPQFVTDMTASNTIYTDPLTNSEDIDQPIPGATYRYYVRAINLNGFTPLSQPVEEKIPFLAPTVLGATTGNPPDWVQLSWQAAEGATSYAVYRDNQDTPIASVSDEDAVPTDPDGLADREWNDYSVPDFNPHTYWLKAVNQYATSEFSGSAEGNIAAAPLAGLAILPGQESGTAPHIVNFNASASFDPDGGDIARFEWDWEGDGTFDFDSGTDATVSHIYETGGSFNPTVEVTDDEGVKTQASVAVEINGPPVAVLNIGAGEEQGEPPHTVNFDASDSTDSNGTIVQYDYDWTSDGIYDLLDGGAVTSYEFTLSEDYTATVRVTDDDGGQGTAQSTEIVVNIPPMADLQSDPTAGEPPLMVTFNASGSTDSDGTIVQYDYDWTTDGTYDLIDGGTAPSHEYPSSGDYTATVRVTDNDGATGTMQSPDIVVNLPPTADLQADPTGGDPPLEVDFDASGSNDPDGVIVWFEWDWDGGGSGPWDASGASPSIQHTYSTGGSKQAWVRVTDDDGSTSTNDVWVDVAEWHIFTPDSDGMVGDHTSLAIVNGNPAVSYMDDQYFDLKYVRASSADGTSWGSPVTVDSAGMVGEYACFAIVNGNPAISYYVGDVYDLKYVRANDADGSSWASPVTVDSAGSVGKFTSLAVVNTYPAISYWDGTNADLKYVRATNTSGSSWGSPVTVASAGSTGMYTCLAVIASKPAISYFHAEGAALNYVRASNAEGSSWGSPVTVDNSGPGNVGLDSSLVVIDSYPAISYWHAGNGDLRYVRASDAIGTTWGSPITPDSAGEVGRYTSLAVVNGNPAISYYDVTNLDLKYVRATAANGETWGTPVTVASDGDVGMYNSLGMVNGKRAISYFDYTNRDLKFAIYY